ncbi:hypothetical protein [Pseudoroseicyclus sp. CXY001]|uniref:hypothetical protein n=1 Tax=Pseudoroseicyclus sp. CXY001 TaxID=3242492 RepID=UPI003570BC69
MSLRHRLSRAAPALTALALLAACSAGPAPGGGGGGGGSPTPGGSESYTTDLAGKEERVAAGGRVLDQVYGGQPMPAVLVPTLGTATYNGAVSFGSDVKDPDYVAAMAVTLDFGTDRVRGSLWDFHDRAGHVAGGSVPINGRMPANAPGSVEAGGRGTLYWGPEVSDVRVDLRGNLYGGEAQWLWGPGTATVTTGGETDQYTATMGGVNDRAN